ncbi:MAG: PRD domain-containing protein, partial [Candidatus Hadarchaeum sp.]
KWLERHGLSLIKTTHLGFRVVGAEAVWRQALLQLLLEALDPKQLLALCARPDHVGPLETRQGGFLGNLVVFFKTLELDFCRQLVERIERLLDVQFTDMGRVSLLLSTAIQIDRIRKEKSIEIASDDLDAIKVKREFYVAEMAADRIARRLKLSMPEQEIAYMAMHLLGAGISRTLSDIIAGNDIHEKDVEVLGLVDNILAEASLYLQPYLRVDQQLIRNLAFHLRTTLHRLRFGLPINNPLLSDIKAQYPYVFQVARRACAVLEDKLGKSVPEEEVGYIAMHIGAAMERFKAPPTARSRVLIVCGEGVATAWLLASRIQAEFPELEVVEVVCASKVSAQYVENHNVVALISTVPIEMLSIPVIVVNPLLTKEDIAVIRARIIPRVSVSRAPERLRDVAGYSLAELLRAETIALQVDARDWVDVVYKAGHLLLRAGAIEPEYVEAMKRIIEQHGPYVVIMPGVALLHAQPGKGVRRTCMSLVTLKQPVPFGHPRHDPVDLAVALGTVDNYSHWRALRQLIEMLNNTEVMRKIKNATAKETVLHLIAEVLASE